MNYIHNIENKPWLNLYALSNLSLKNKEVLKKFSENICS